MVHCASLIIDDLPCMDDADTASRQRANHLVHGEDIAILGAITLISEALAQSPVDAWMPGAKAALIAHLSDAIGFDGLCAGQERDLGDIS